jgi:hypothetical protein
MPAPFDYTLDIVDPVAAMQSGMAFGQNQRANEQAMVMNAQNMELAQSQEGRAQTAFQQQNLVFDQQQQDRAKAQEAAAAMQSDLAGLAAKIEGGDYSSQDFAAIAAKYPDLVDEMSKMWEGTTSERKAADVSQLFQGVSAIKAGRPDLAVQMLEERAVAAENSGDQREADIARATAAAIKADPAAGLTSLGLLLQTVDPDAAVSVFGEGRRVQSTNAYANGTTVTVFSDGSKEVTDAAGTVLAGPDAQIAVDAAIASEATLRGGNAAASEEGKLKTKIDLGGEAAASEEAGKQAIAKSGEAFDSLNKVQKNLANINVAIDAIDNGAAAGAIEKYFPDITTASASLTNAMNQLGLDVIGSVTFGALSEGEMKLAMETAVPRNLDGPELREWLVQKKAAQEKAADALRAAAIYLGTPGNTLKGWLESQGKTTAADGSGSPPAAGGQTADDILKEIEGL